MALLRWSIGYVVDRLMILVTIYLAYQLVQNPVREVKGNALAAIQTLGSPFEKLSRALE